VKLRTEGRGRKTVPSSRRAIAAAVTLAALSFAALGAPSSAAARTFTEKEQGFVSVARAYWHAAPACTPTWQVVPYLGSDVLGLQQGCTVRLAQRALLSDERACSVVVHEYGHLLGHAHDPSDPVMRAFKSHARPCELMYGGECEWRADLAELRTRRARVRPGRLTRRSATRARRASASCGRERSRLSARLQVG